MKKHIAFGLLLGWAAAALGQPMEYGPAPHARPTSTDQIIVKWRTPTGGVGAEAKLSQWSSVAGARVQRKRSLSPALEVLKLERAASPEALAELIAQLNSDPQIEYAVPDMRRRPHAVPSDPLFIEQWYLLSEQASATRAERAWDITTGGATVVAVLDTGVRYEHPDLGRVEQGGKLLPGYDFISDALVANDGDGRDADASDPGDWITEAEAQQPPFDAFECLPEGATQANSSWHGTRVASLIGATTNNGLGVAGSAWGALILPVRVLGKCGGYDSDILEGMRWAVGLPVPNAPANPHPARILNLSFGGAGSCSLVQQAAVDEITAHGVLIVASVGNDGGPVDAPANCRGVLSVAGLRQEGTKVGFSNLGPQVALSAPGGNCVNTSAGQPCLFSIVAATNHGLTSPTSSGYTDQFNYNVGTSFSAPLAAGVAALMRSVNSRLEPAHYISILRETAAAFPSGSTTTSTLCRVPSGAADLQAHECVCTTQTCGAGMLDAHAAVLAAQRPVAILDAPATIQPGVETPIDASGSFASDGREIGAYAWSITNVSGAAPTLADATQATTLLRASGATQFTLRLTVTDDQGAQGAAEMRIATPSNASATPANAPRKGGGGGGMDPVGFAALLLLAFVRLGRHVQTTRQLA
ncbi:MAG: S8 family serine peptidase [Steroidobacteraceae bacterium]|jgi:serine protease|nr:S8 family serine peptidase [Steroidobacteraceae bacterium]